jgi:hypothetical protein
MKLMRLLAVTCVPALLFAACGNDDDDASSTTAEASARQPVLEGEITVFAAASLTDAFTELHRWRVVAGGGDGRLGGGVRGMRHSVGRSWPAPGEGAGSADGGSPGGAGVGQAHLAVPGPRLPGDDVVRGG